MLMRFSLGTKNEGPAGHNRRLGGLSPLSPSLSCCLPAHQQCFPVTTGGGGHRREKRKCGECADFVVGGVNEKNPLDNFMQTMLRRQLTYFSDQSERWKCFKEGESWGELRACSGLGGKRVNHMGSCNLWGFISGETPAPRSGMAHQAPGPWTSPSTSPHLCILTGSKTLIITTPEGF